MYVCMYVYVYVYMYILYMLFYIVIYIVFLFKSKYGVFKLFIYSCTVICTCHVISSPPLVDW